MKYSDTEQKEKNKEKILLKKYANFKSMKFGEIIKLSWFKNLLLLLNM